MPKPHATREDRADRLLARMPSVPPAVRARFRAAFILEEPKVRGVPKALQIFFARLAAKGIAFERVGPEDFRAAATSRTGFRALVAALDAYAPEVPLAAAAPVRKEWDRWLNARYNAKPKQPRKSTRIVTLPGDWPAQWQEALPALDETRRSAGRIFRPLAPKTHASVVQAVGMAETARTWAADRGIALSPTIDGDLAEVLVRYLTHERAVSARTIHDYLERLRVFALRGGLLADDDHAEIGAILSDLHAEAADADPAKRAKVSAFRRNFDLTDVLLRAYTLGQEATALPDWSAGAERKRRAAVILALLVNTADRQGDLSTHRIGVELQREPDGAWVLDFHQSKTGRRKANGPLWPVTAQLIEDHILAGRPDWCLPDRLAELQGCNLLSLSSQGFGLYHPSAILREEFGISGHLVRTLITDAVRNGRPDAAWAAQALMGHINRTMQQTYRTDFRETAAMKSWHDTLEALQGGGL